MTEVLLKRIKSLKENIKIIEKYDTEVKLNHTPLSLPINLAHRFLHNMKTSKGKTKNGGVSFSEYQWEFDLFPAEENARILSILESKDGLLSEFHISQIERLSEYDYIREEDLEEWMELELNTYYNLEEERDLVDDIEKYMNSQIDSIMSLYDIINAHIKILNDRENHNEFMRKWADKILTIYDKDTDDELIKRNIEIANKIKTLNLFNMGYVYMYNDFYEELLQIVNCDILSSERIISQYLLEIKNKSQITDLSTSK